MFFSEAQQILEVPEAEIVFYDEKPSIEEVIEAHEDESPSEEEPSLEIENVDEVNIGPVIVIDDIPGAPPGTSHPTPEPPKEEILEVEEKESDKNSAKDSTTDDSWCWNKSTPFENWAKDKYSKIPKHSGYDSAGLERAVAYLQKLDKSISKAMREDLEGELEGDMIQAIREEIEKGIDLLQERLDAVVDSKKPSKKRKKSAMVKEASRTYDLKGMYITVPILIARIARVCINGVVSAGHDLRDIYEDQVKKYKLTDREQAEVQQLLMDMGHALPVTDRGYAPGEKFDLKDGKYDLASNYPG